MEVQRTLRSPIRVRSLGICILPLRVADVCPSPTENCEGLHSTGITRLPRYSDLHPMSTRLLPASLSQLVVILDSVQFHCQDRGGPPGSFTFTMCCSMLSMTPERKTTLVVSVMAPVACVFFNRIGPLKFSHDIGAYYQIQRLTLHLATFARLRVSPLVLRCRVSDLSLSIVRRVPSYSINSRYALRRTYGMK